MGHLVKVVLFQILPDRTKSTMLTLALAALLVCAASANIFGGCPTVSTQTNLTISPDYLGDWYEIFAFPTKFEPASRCTRARYSIKDDGHIEVFNRGFKLSDGKNNSIIGDLYRPDESHQGKLKVRFAAGTPYGNYWVVHMDHKQYSLVYSCSSILGLAHIEMAWILSRTMTIDATITQSLMDELASYKVDVSKFKATDQTGCPA